MKNLKNVKKGRERQIVAEKVYSHIRNRHRVGERYRETEKDKRRRKRRTNGQRKRKTDGQRKRKTHRHKK